jgi:hypothetical protein
MTDYAWQQGWPFRGTVAMTMDIGTDHAFELSVSYSLQREEVKPTLEVLWIMMARAIGRDGISLPDFVSREWARYAAYCQKINQSIHVLWRQNLTDGTLPRIAEDHGLPAFTVYRLEAEIRLRDIEKLGCGAEGTVRTLYGAEISIAKIPSTQSAYNASMFREGEEPRIPEEVLLQQPGISKEEAKEYNRY